MIEEDIELKLVMQPETPLQNKEPFKTEIPLLSSSDLSQDQCEKVKEKLQNSDELKSKSVSNSSQSDM